MKGFDKMNNERLVRIGKFLNDRLIIHRNVENDTPWTTEEKMIQELYDSYLYLLKQNQRLEHALDKIENILNCVCELACYSKSMYLDEEDIDEILEIIQKAKGDDK